jgi:hypothetical protein
MHSKVGSRRPPILVTGYFATTWGGRMLARCHGLAHPHEAFNPRIPAGPRHQSPYWYIHNSGQRRRAPAGTLAFRHGVPSRLGGWKWLAPVARMVRESVDLAWRLRVRPPIKSPIAPLGPEWLRRTFRAGVVLIRHPAACAHSIKAPLAHHVDRLTRFAARERDIADQAGFLYRMLADAVLGLRRRHPEWLRRARDDSRRSGQHHCR